MTVINSIPEDPDYIFYAQQEAAFIAECNKRGYPTIKDANGAFIFLEQRLRWSGWLMYAQHKPP